jgi:hypothetical protein
LPGNQVAIQFRERDQLGDVTRAFEFSSDLIHWAGTSPSGTTVETNLNGISVYQAIFPILQNETFYRIRYSLDN